MPCRWPGPAQRAADCSPGRASRARCSRWPTASGRGCGARGAENRLLLADLRGPVRRGDQHALRDRSLPGRARVRVELNLRTVGRLCEQVLHAAERSFVAAVYGDGRSETNPEAINAARGPGEIGAEPVNPQRTVVTQLPRLVPVAISDHCYDVDRIDSIVSLHGHR